MAPVRPRFPRTTKAQRQPGPDQQSLFEIPAVPKVKAPEPARIRKPEPGQGALDPRFRKNYRRRITEKDEEGFRWWQPTATSNPARPRTLVAGYNAGERTLRVVFRDGTPWNYYGVEPIVAQRFKRSASPGRFINRVLNQYPYERGEWEPPTT